MSELRLLKPSDLESLLELSRHAGCMHTEEDWLRLLELAPEGCLGFERDGRIVSSVTSVSYGKELAWIGMVLTHPEHRSGGHLGKLLEHSIELLRYRGVGWIKLDASPEGKPYLEKMGFTEERRVERWRRNPAELQVPEVTDLHPFIYDPVMERLAFGGNRFALLNKLSEHPHACIPGKAFAMERPTLDAVYFGPCVARTTGSARTLMNWFLGRHAMDTVYWDLLPGNLEAVQLAAETGFELVGRFSRMVLPGREGAPPLSTNESSVYAIGGFEWG
jgi:GNAT superfamily N-acetyltransferase